MSDERGTAERMAEFRSPLFAPLDKTPPLKFDPLHDHILMRKQPHEERSAGGLFLPAPAPNSADARTHGGASPRLKWCKAEVLAVGPGVWRDGKLIPPSVKPGDRVLVQALGGVVIEINGESLWVVPATDVLGVVR